MERADDIVPMGEVVGLHGVRGWVKVYSHTEPREAILDYPHWYLRRDDGDWVPVERTAGRRQGKGLVAALRDVEDRDRARAYIGLQIGVPRRDLPELPEGQYYWVDLEGLAAYTTGGEPLGRVSHLFATGANDVLVLQGDRERLVPFVYGQTVRRVDLTAGRIELDWDPDF
ncbi:ribosome maturation factor RimM [Alkalilimnicola ehrlichii]|uniref:ribosome maturation factor RimM n=1 Tax=Alkalilimnicola ehrlichii TaxID=351052 RepID=UPI003BA27A99